jgi:hypothetical protein
MIPGLAIWVTSGQLLRLDNIFIMNIEMNDSSEKVKGVFSRNSNGFKILLLLIFVMAALVRRDEIKAPGHLIEREYNSAVFARAYYYENNTQVEAWRQDIARITKEQYPTLEPPITEYLVSIIYRLVGKEDIALSRYLTSFFWLVSGIFLLLISRKLLSAEASLYALIYYLFVPMGITISRSFQPDSLMMMLFLASLFFILVYSEKISWGSLLTAAILTGTTLLVRPLVIFILFSVFITLSISNKGTWKAIFNRHAIVFILIALAFPFAFYGVGILITGTLSGQAALSFRPHLLLKPQFWEGWFELAVRVFSQTAVIAAFAGWILIGKKTAQSLGIGMLIGYFIFGVFFTYHIITHSYYHIQFFPAIALGASVFMVYLGRLLKQKLGNNWWAPIGAILLFFMYFSYQDHRDELYTRVFEDPKLAVEIGEAVNHSSRTVFISYHYGAPLEYYGEFAGAPWPNRIDDPFYRPPGEREKSIEERLKSLGYDPDYFIITNFDLYHKKHKDLQAYLEANCTIHTRSEKYLIFKDCQTGYRKLG